MTEPGCQLILRTPPELASEIAFEDFCTTLEATLVAAPVAGLLVCRHQLDDRALARAGHRLRPLAEAAGTVLLVEARVELAAGFDGVQITAPGPAVAAARQQIGPEAIVGVACGRSRHEAMVAGEAGADYIAFQAADGALEDTLELVAWWHEVMLPPVVVEVAADDQAAHQLASGGADFLSIGPGLWDHPDGPAKALESLAKSLG